MYSLKLIFPFFFSFNTGLGVSTLFHTKLYGDRDMMITSVILNSTILATMYSYNKNPNFNRIGITGFIAGYGIYFICDKFIIPKYR